MLSFTTLKVSPDLKGKKKKLTMLTLSFLFPWEQSNNPENLRCDVCAFSTIWPPNSEGRHRSDKGHYHLHNTAGLPIFNKGEETQWRQRKYQTFLCRESIWPRLKLFDKWLSDTYMAKGDFSLMADWACQQSRFNLRFDMLQAGLFDSHDSNCHLQL